MTADVLSMQRPGWLWTLSFLPALALRLRGADRGTRRIEARGGQRHAADRGTRRIGLSRPFRSGDRRSAPGEGAERRWRRAPCKKTRPCLRARVRQRVRGEDPPAEGGCGLQVMMPIAVDAREHQVFQVYS